jgi:hypothetical protein
MWADSYTFGRLEGCETNLKKIQLLPKVVPSQSDLSETKIWPRPSADLEAA